MTTLPYLSTPSVIWPLAAEAVGQGAPPTLAKLTLALWRCMKRNELKITLAPPPIPKYLPPPLHLADSFSFLPHQAKECDWMNGLVFHPPDQKQDQIITLPSSPVPPQPTPRDLLTPWIASHAIRADLAPRSVDQMTSRPARRDLRVRRDHRSHARPGAPD